ncbi:hypothetical protein [Chloroflexus sp.]|uniref:hypothetical protein n=1 Tax=Chloroflexus sp. TaxID=1904827 RepID=UPI002ACF000E|nr:hypothetical protein [Chloroflexus sp.]
MLACSGPFFLTAYWLDINMPLPNLALLPAARQGGWWLSAGVRFVLAAAVWWPTIRFG